METSKEIFDNHKMQFNLNRLHQQIFSLHKEIVLLFGEEDDNYETFMESLCSRVLIKDTNLQENTE